MLGLKIILKDKKKSWGFEKIGCKLDIPKYVKAHVGDITFGDMLTSDKAIKRLHWS